MSGIETVKIIVNAEKEAAKVVAEAQAKASEIRKGLDPLIQQQREETLKRARDDASKLLETTQNEAKVEAQEVEAAAESNMRRALDRASQRKGSATEKLVQIIMELHS